MLETLQILQISFFAVTILGLFILGLLILARPVFFFHRRWFLLIFLPLLLANPLALVEEYALLESAPAPSWRLCVTLAIDLGLIAAGLWLLSGWLVYGLSEKETANAFQAWCEAQGWELTHQPDIRNTWWGGSRQAQLFQVSKKDQTHVFWLLSQGSEVRLEGETPEANFFLRKALPALNQTNRPYQFQEHLTGILYIVLAIVLTVLGWIFFFEPRLILIE